ncbi:CocE/NonD family hydrolase [Streptomyces sp. RS10V-4]|uniref:CocE/NonD family hydrolase n=1 Tax=Streptomyces rhizoryzae TaxID=2932493 RepID=UPI002006722F|nr:CocE/NonD family hydrolase [Streptomyces rhizoryzae]MCK7622496.1 CocE/NonD family hydrolase [Streptomyces rhizoryzae]
MTATVLVPMDDGVRLATDLRLPDRPGRHPAVLIRTPYDRHAHRAELRAWAAHGFAAAVQDVRGRHGSEGRWRPFHGEAADGAATLRFLRAQEWSDGRIVTAGSSYAAHCALATATATGGGPGGRPDAVIAAVPALGPAEAAREPHGPERLLARAGWWAAHGDRSDSDPDALGRALAADPELLAHLPVAALPVRLGRALPSWRGVWDAERPGTLLRTAGRAAVPLLAVAGSRDPFADDTHCLWQAWGGPARLLTGPWGHGLTAEPGPGARPAHRLALGTLYVRFARAALDGRLFPGPRGAIALAGSDLWFRPGERTAPQVWRFGARDGLRPLRGPDFTADPVRPVRSDTLDVPAAGPPDRCLLVTPPLPRPLDLLGPAEARLTAVADAAPADWAVRVAALAPDGRAEPLALGVVRRADPPGTSAEFTVPLGRPARRLPAGTRLRVEVAGHHFPAHVRQPHTGEDPVTATRLRASRRSVRLTGSALVLHTGRTRGVDPVQEISR